MKFTEGMKKQYYLLMDENNRLLTENIKTSTENTHLKEAINFKEIQLICKDKKLFKTKFKVLKQ